MPRVKTLFVYILASRRNGTLYIGVTNDLLRRMSEHTTGRGSEFVRAYNITDLVYYESTDSPYGAITREKQLKKWRRAWKIELIEQHNPGWKNLHEGNEIRPLPR